MSIDLDSAEGRKKYLSEKLDDLLDGITDSYGTILMEELLSRLELTVKDFNEEMKVLCDEMVAKEQERQHLLEMLKSNVVNEPEKPASNKTGPDTSKDFVLEQSATEYNGQNEDVPEWEKKLAKLEKNN